MAVKEKIDLRASVVYHKATKGPYKWSHTLMLQDKDCDLFIWTSVQSGGPGDVVDIEEGQRIHLQGYIEETKSIAGGQMLTRITQCKVLQ